MARTVERHVFQKMGETVLVVLLLEGADIVDDIEVCTACRIFIVPYIICQAVLQTALDQFRVIGDDCLCPSRDGQYCHKENYRRYYFCHSFHTCEIQCYLIRTRSRW